MASGVAPAINTVDSLLKKTFDRLKFEDKLAIKQLGSDKPDIRINQQTKDRGKSVQQNFLPSMVWEEKMAMWLLKKKHHFFL